MDDKAIDTAIDEVAREMTAGEPHGGFRAQVVARIDSFVVRRWWFVVRGSWFVVRGSSFAVIAALAVMFVVSQVRHRGPSLERVERPESGAVSMARPQGPSLQRRGTEQPESRPLHNRRASVERRDAEIAPSPVAALAPPRLDVDSIAVGELQAPVSIDVDELQRITSIAVAPLSVDDQGERR